MRCIIYKSICFHGDFWGGNEQSSCNKQNDTEDLLVYFCILLEPGTLRSIRHVRGVNPNAAPSSRKIALFILVRARMTRASDSHWEGRQRSWGTESRGRQAVCPESLGPQSSSSSREGPAEPSPDRHPQKGKQETLQKAKDSPVAADPPQDDAFMINTHDNLRPKCCYNTNCPWKLTCSKAAEFSFDRPGSRVQTWLGMTGDIHASKISKSGWRDFAHCKEAGEILHSWLLVRKAKRAAGVAFLRVPFQTGLSFAWPWIAGLVLFSPRCCSYHRAIN